MKVPLASGDMPEENEHIRVTPEQSAAVGDDVVSLDMLMTIGAIDELLATSQSREPRDVEWLQSVERITNKGWQSTLRALLLLVGPAAVWQWQDELLPAICTTVVLLAVGARFPIRKTRVAHAA